MAQTGQRCSRDRVPGRAVGPLKHPEGPGLPLGDLGREAQRTARCPNERSGLLGGGTGAQWQQGKERGVPGAFAFPGQALGVRLLLPGG